MKRRPMPPTPTLGELQKALDRQAKTIAKIEETLTLLLLSLCRECRMNSAMVRMKTIPKEKS